MDSNNPEEEHPVKAHGWAAKDSSGILSPFNFSRRKTGERDVTFKVLYCGICHTDLSLCKNEWGVSRYPLVPGHEMVGVVTETGKGVEKFRPGDRVGVGYYVGSCTSCDQCESDLEIYCSRVILTIGSTYHDGTVTYGGFSDIMVADERYVIRIPDNLSLDAACPLLCAGVTVYSPLNYYGLNKPGSHVGVVGLGGLGHVAVKFAKAMGCKVTVISTSSSKKQEALERHGADTFLVSHDTDQMKAAIGTLDGIIDAVSAAHPLPPLLDLLKPSGKLIMLGASAEPFQLPIFSLLPGRKMVGGSSTGGIKETQEMIDFAAKHGICADIEVVRMDYVNTAMERLHKGDVKYRFVIDIGNSMKSAT